MRNAAFYFLRGALRGSNPPPPVPQTSALPNELKAPQVGIEKGYKPSSVVDGHLSRPRTVGHVVAFVTALDFRPWRATCKRSNRRLLRGGLPFSFHRQIGGYCFCCSRVRGHANLDCQHDRSHASLTFIRHPRSVQLGLSSEPMRGQRPSTFSASKP